MTKSATTDKPNPTPGSVVRCRQRHWVVLPSDNPDLIRLRPLSGDEEQTRGVYRPLLGELENIEPAEFPLPTAEAVQDHTAARLLMDAARLSLRSGAGPFRCLGRLSLRPRPYQLVPLLMALRLETARLLIADDVGIGKTIEAGLIARELLDRAEVKRLAVLCPPRLCDQWQRELREKFHIDAVVVRSGTVSKLERSLPSGDHHVFGYYRHIIVSLDYAKSDRRRASFLAHCPDLVIVDEAHTCAIRSNAPQTTGSSGGSQQQRHQLVEQVAAKSDRHLILLTATPHSGIETSFLSLVGLINPQFEHLDLDNLSESDRAQLAKHFVQRRRADVQQWLGDETPFPQRDSLEESYRLSQEYRQLFDKVYEFARGLVVDHQNQDIGTAQQRGRYWSALAIIRCVMSSPAAAVATLTRKASQIADSEEVAEELDEELAAAYTDDPTEREQVIDATPKVVVDRAQRSYKETDKRKLREFAKTAQQLQGKKDAKLQKAIALVKNLLDDEFTPIIWCRYVATANYVTSALAEQLEKKKRDSARVIGITGELSEDEREARLEELLKYRRRVLVATDCLSEGLNLQEHFTAVIHYDLPWNPNRLEQREGRVDRYGQVAPTVKCVLLYGQDNPVDGAVLDVLLRKAKNIHKALGIAVPVPMDNEAVSEALFQSLFERASSAQQLSLLDLLEDGDSPVTEVRRRWDHAVQREQHNRTRFAQRTIKPEEVKRELQESDAVLGSQQEVERFTREALERLNASLVKKNKAWYLPHVPRALEPVLGNQPRSLSFESPAPEGVEPVGRNHPLVEGLARHLLEEALKNPREAVAARCGVTVTDAVSYPVVVLLVRSRYLLQPYRREEQLLAEECLTLGFSGPPSNPQWLSVEQARELLETAEPTEDLPLAQKQARIKQFLGDLEELSSHLDAWANDRAQALKDSHRRVRTMTKEGAVKVMPQLPMDILGICQFVPE